MNQYDNKMDIKYTKSIIKTNPDSRELSELLNFVPLLLIQKGNITINPRGLKIIQTQVQGKLHLIALEGQKQFIIYNLFRNQRVIKQDRKVSGLWISSFPRYHRERNVSYLYVETAAINHEERITIHNLCSLICSLVLVDKQEPNISYVTSVEGRVIYSRKQATDQKVKQNRKVQLANFALLQTVKGPYKTAEKGINSMKVIDIYSKLNIFNECTKIYKTLDVLTISTEQLQKFNLEYLKQLQNQIKQKCETKPQKTEDLMSGPILSWYIEKIVEAMNNPITGRIVQIQKCINSIEVTEGYLAFVKASQAYHRLISKQLREDGVSNLKQILSIARQDAIEQYKKYSMDAEYLVLLGDHIDARESRLIEQNNKILDLKNISYLKMGSEQLLKKIQRQKMDEVTAQKQIDIFVENYKNTAIGDNKFELLTNYLKYLDAAVYKTVNEKQTKKLKQQIQVSKNEVRGLQQRLKELQNRANRPPQNKCCELM